MKWTEPSIFLGGVLTGALLFVACNHGNEPPAQTSGAAVDPPANVPSGIDGTPPVSKPPDTPATTFEGNPGKAQEDNAQKAPTPPGSGTAVGGP